MKDSNTDPKNENGGGGGGGTTTIDAIKSVPTWLWPVIVVVVLGAGFLGLKLLKVL